MKKFLTVCFIVCALFTAQNTLFGQTADTVCDPPTTVDAIVDPGQATACSDGSDAIIFPAANGSLPDADYVIEVNGIITEINADGSVDAATLAVGDQVCATAFAYDLAAIDGLLTTANQLCPLIDCDATFGIPGITQAISDLANGVNDGVPGLNSLQEALDFAGSFGTPITDVATASATLDALNAQIGALGMICYATSAPVCYDIIDCTPVCTAMASAISTTDPTRICVDGVGDPINVAVDTDGGATAAWVITDAAGIILALPPGPPFDLDGAGAGQCLIWLVNFDDANFAPMVGDDAAAAVAASSCAFLSNPITVDRIEVTAPTISTTDPTRICIDGVGDPINVTIDDAGIGANATWVITDAAATILALPPGPPFDLDGAGPGQCLIWLVNSDDPNFAPAVGDDAAAAVANATCAALSNPITVDRIEVTAPTISTTDPTTICVDGVGDPINVTIDDAGIGANSAWVITDAAATILALPAGPPFDLDGAGAGQCLIWYVNFDDPNFAPAVGDDAAALVAASTCAALSNPITVDRIEVTAPAISTTDPTTICIDGVGDPINVNIDDAGIGANSAWVITDANATILALPPGPPFDLDGAGPGTCLIWLVNFEDPNFAPAVGDDAAAAVAASTCAALSNPITVDRKEVTAPVISTTDVTEICADDGVADIINVNIDDAGTGATATAWVITDANGIILALPPAPPFDLEGAGAGTCLIWLANIDDPNFAPAVGDDATAAVAAATCVTLSNPIAVTRADNCAPMISISDPCNCTNGIDTDGDGVINLAAETITISPGAAPYTITGYSGGLVDMNNMPLDQAAIQALIDAAVPDADGNLSFTAYLPADGATVFSIDISDGNGATASFTKPMGCPSCAEPAAIPTVGEWGLIILGLLMTITAVIGIRQRREEEMYA